MITKYKIMRGFFKSKFARDFAWQFLTFVSRKKYENYISDFSACKDESIFDFDDDMVSQTVSKLREEGACLGVSLPGEYIDHLIDYSKANPCYADRDPKKGFFLNDLKKAEQYLGRRILLAQYLDVHQDDCISKIAKDPYLLQVAAKYLKMPPELVSLNFWWTFPVKATAEEKARHAHVFHYDLDDIKFVKFFFYVTDVDMSAGPHVYVKGSNKEVKYKNSLYKSKRYSDEEVVQAYGEENIVYATGQAGTCLIEDTITLHKGVTPDQKPRLMFQVQFAINKYDGIGCVSDESEREYIV